jgi:perosamine synthetase
MPHKLAVAQPAFLGNEKTFVKECMDTAWISSAGKYLGLFESRFADFCGVKHAIACCNGTVALHLALLALDVQAGDEVIVPTLTFVATPNAVTYCGARPVFVDSEPYSWNIDPRQIEKAITTRTKGIIAVHLYGHPADMSALQDIAARHELFLLEDAAQAHGARCGDATVGSIGDAAAFSFYANKIITTGEGGMVVTNSVEIADRTRLLRGQGMDPNRRYWHPIVGYNYRMTNLAAAIGLAQTERAEELIALRAEIGAVYRERLQGLPGLEWQEPVTDSRPVDWMFSITMDRNYWPERDIVIQWFSQDGIETRPVFYPAHTMPPYRPENDGKEFPVADHISSTGISLPTWVGMTKEQADHVCDLLQSYLRRESSSKCPSLKAS